MTRKTIINRLLSKFSFLSGEKSTHGEQSAKQHDKTHGKPEKTEIKAWQTQYHHISDDAESIQIIIGLDFGTAFTKVVISGAGQRFSVPLNNNGKGVDRYLLPTRIYEDKENNFSLFELENSISSHTDLKMNIIENKLNKKTKKHIAKYIELVLQKSRVWLMTEKQSIFGNNQLKWAVNVGLPTSNYSDKKLQKIYQKIIRTAWYESTAPSRGSTTEKIKNTNRKLHRDYIKSFPEFVAQIQSYLSSPQKKHAYIHTLIDIGAGTVDVTVFIVYSDESGHRNSILDGSVERLGTTYLASYRFENLGQSTNWNPNIKELFPSISEFSAKLGVTLEQISNVDEKFKYKVIDQVESCFKSSKQVAPEPGQWNDGVPLLLCGGGARVDFYKEISSVLTKINRGFPLNYYRLPNLKKQLDAPGVPDEDFDRLSVAYGLSFDAPEIGKIKHLRPIPKDENINRGKNPCPQCRGRGDSYSHCSMCGGSGFI